MTLRKVIAFYSEKQMKAINATSVSRM